jgi:uncharacterized protein YjbI with pentapeptide repeats
MNVYLTGVYLIGVYLTGVHLMGVYFIGVQFMDVYLISVHLVGMHLMGMYLVGMHLSGKLALPTAHGPMRSPLPCEATIAVATRTTKNTSNSWTMRCRVATRD